MNNNNAKVIDYIGGGNWNMDKLREDLPEHIVLYIANIPIRDANDNDYAVWNITQDGQYTNSSAWQIIREVRQKDGILSNIWHKCLPFILSYLEMMLKILPFDEVIQWIPNAYAA